MSESSLVASAVDDLDVIYSKLVAEVYIDPIRSVVVVDDEFPTLDALIAKEMGEPKGWTGNIRDVEAVRDILAFCRNRSRPWLVDVHDGREINIDDEVNIAQHLHHSDLMILDYHLLGDSGTGEKSIKVLKKLAANPHFNLVVVYTKGYDGDIATVFSEIAIALSHSKTVFQEHGDFSRISDSISNWEVDEDDVSQRILDLCSKTVYLKEISTPGSFCRSSGMSLLLNIYKSKFRPQDLSSSEIIFWMFQSTHNRMVNLLSSEDFGTVSSSYSPDVNWIKTDSLFITIVDKSHKAEQLAEKLEKALGVFGPAPHQLLMARMRSEIDEKGVIAEAAVLDDKYMQAGWLAELFNHGASSKSSVIRTTVDRHWEALGDRLRKNVDDFANRLLDYLYTQGSEKVMKRYGGGVHGEVDKVLAHVNLYNSTKPVDYSHLRTGHIFTLDNDSEKEFWICLSPACDLVPGQKIGGWRKSLGGRVPFVAVRLSELKISTALEKIHENVNVFIQLEGIVRAFSYCPEGNSMAAPHWEQMLVLNGGGFVDTSGGLSICQFFDRNGFIETRESNVTVIAQLRNEYAANLLQKLGWNFSRVGLNFRSKPER